jgi:hypothetical protein
MVSNIFDSDFLRLKEYLAARFPGMEHVPEEEYDLAFAEYEEMYPMNLLLLEKRFEFIFYNRPIGVLEHYWKIPGYHMIWKNGEFKSALKAELLELVKAIKSK